MGEKVELEEVQGAHIDTNQLLEYEAVVLMNETIIIPSTKVVHRLNEN